MSVQRLQAGKNAKQDNTNNKCKFKPLDNNGMTRTAKSYGLLNGSWVLFGQEYRGGSALVPS